jgi:membrane protease YdiL (CAAX protease family)
MKSEELSKSTFWLVVLLLLLRIPILKSIEHFINPLPGWSIQIFELIMYSLIAILIYRERDHLADYFIDKLAVVIFIFLGTILRLFTLDYTSSICLIELVFWAVALILILLLRKNNVNFAKIRAENYVWLFNGLLVGLVLSFILAIPRYLVLEEQILQQPHNYDGMFVFFLASLVTQFVHSSVIEEFIFRGFLWGCLRKIGLSNMWILFIQAGLFWVAHINYIDRSYSFWIALPIGGLVMGLLAWKSKSIATSMVLHSVYNAMTYLIFDLIAYLR